MRPDNNTELTGFLCYCPEKIISGGQTGVDMGALLAAEKLRIQTGGYAPDGWKTERGANPGLANFGLIQSHSTSYAVRTKHNVKMSDAVLCIASDKTWGSPGTVLTIDAARAMNKPLGYATFDFHEFCAPQVRRFLDVYRPRVLMVAGNRESKCPGIEKWTEEFLVHVFLDTMPARE